MNKKKQNSVFVSIWENGKYQKTKQVLTKSLYQRFLDTCARHGIDAFKDFANCKDKPDTSIYEDSPVQSTGVINNWAKRVKEATKEKPFEIRQRTYKRLIAFLEKYEHASIQNPEPLVEPEPDPTGFLISNPKTNVFTCPDIRKYDSAGAFKANSHDAAYKVQEWIDDVCMHKEVMEIFHGWKPALFTVYSWGEIYYIVQLEDKHFFALTGYRRLNGTTGLSPHRYETFFEAWEALYEAQNQDLKDLKAESQPLAEQTDFDNQSPVSA